MKNGSHLPDRITHTHNFQKHTINRSISVLL